MDFSRYVADAFSELTPDINNIYNNQKESTLDSIRSKNIAMAASSGGAAVAIPILHVAGVAADVAFLMNRMSVASYSIGVVKGHDAGYGNFLEEEDFLIVLGVWAGEESITAGISAKAAADFSTKVYGKSALKMIAKTMLKNVGVIASKKMGGKLATKVGAKFGAKLGGKVAAGFVPFLGAAVGAGINYYFINSVCDAAEKVYDYKIRVAQGIT